MPKYIEVLQDGLTAGGRVHSRGAVATISDDSFIERAAQVDRWGAPRYKEITEKEFVERGGTVQAPAQSQPIGEGPEKRAEEFGDPYDPSSAEAFLETVEETEEEFSEVADTGVDETLEIVANYDEAKLQRFVDYEKANKNRSGVLGPLGAE